MIIRLLYKLIATVAKLCAIVLILALVVVLYFTSTTSGQRQLAGLISAAASNDTQTVQLSPIQGLLSGNVEIASIRLINNETAEPWLAIDNAHLSWQPLALLKSTAKINFLTADRLAILAAPPSSDAPKSNEPFSLPSLPVSIYLKHWDFADIALAADVAGQDMQLSTTGLLHVDKDARDIQLQVEAHREDNTPGNLAAKIRFTPDENALAVDVSAAEPLGGVIAHWLQQDHDSNTTFTLKGNGDLQDWQGQLTLLLNGEPHAQLILQQQQLSHPQNNDPIRHAIGINGDIRIADIVGRLLPPESNLPTLLSGSTTIAHNSTLSLSPIALALHTTSVTNAQWSADMASGTINPDLIAINDILLQATGAPIPIHYADNEALVRAFSGHVQLARDAASTVDAVGVLALAHLRTGDVVANEVRIEAQTDDFAIAEQTGKVAYEMTMSKLDIPDVKLPPIGQKPFDLTGTAQIDQGVIHLQDQLLTIDDNQLAVDATIDPKSLAFQASLQALLITADLLDNPAVPNAAETITLQTALDGNLSTGPTINLQTLSVSTEGLALSGTAQAIGGAITASLTATAPELGAFAPQINGALHADLTIMGDIDDLAITFGLHSPELQVNSETISNISGQASVALVDYQPNGSVTVTGNYQDKAVNLSSVLYQQDRQLVANPIAVQLGNNRLAGQIRLTDAGMPIGDFSIDFPELATIGKIANLDLSGDASGTIALTAPADLDTASNTTTVSTFPEIRGHLRSTVLRLPPAEVRDFSGNVTIHHWHQQQPDIDTQLRAAKISASGQSFVDAAINTTGKLDDWLINAQMHHQANQANSANQPITLQGRLQQQGDQRDLMIETFAGHYNGVPITLSPNTNISLTPKLVLPPITLNIAGGTIDTSGTLSDPTDMMITFTDIDLTQFRDFLPPGTALNGIANGKAHITGSQQDPIVDVDLSINQLSVTQLGQQGIEPLQATIKGRFADNIVTLTSVRTDNSQGARVLADGTIDLSQQALNLTVDGNIPLAIAQPILARQQISASGSIDADLQIRGTFAQPDISGKLIGQQLSVTEQRTGISATALALDVGLTGDKVQINQLSSPLSSGGQISVDGSVGIQSQTLNLAINGALPISIADDILAQQRLSGDGQVLVDIAVGGAISSPQLSGRVTCDQLSLTDSRSGMQADNIDLAINFTGDQAIIERLTAPLSSGGSIAASGTIGTQPSSGFPLAIDIRLTNANITDGDVLTTQLNGKISVSGAVQSALQIAGNIDVGKTDIVIPSNLPANIALLNVEHINAPADILSQDARLAKPAPKSNRDSNISLDLAINAPNQIFITGRGIDAELGGKLTLQGPVNNPRTIGGLKIKRGRLNFLEKRLDFTRGNITFAGSLTPILDFTAKRQAADTLITIRVTGQATDPEFDFSSVPELPQSELIAKLLFERSYDDLSAFQLFQLAQATAQLTGAYLGPSLTGQLKQAIGVDDVDIKSDPKTGETSIEVGKYLNDRTYVTVEQGASPENNKATINLDIGRGLGVKGEANQAGEAKVGIYYEKEY